jgi:uncharacterized phage protein (TIGR01671 family)
MREIKFRAWNINNSEPVGEAFTLQKAIGSRRADGVDTREVVYMQFTGLLDKNGKEIYDGDVVRLHCGGFGHNKIIATIKWLEEYARFVPEIHEKKIKVNGGIHNGMMVDMREIHGWSGMHTCLGDKDNIEVIGNIYENPELLKAE